MAVWYDVRPAVAGALASVAGGGGGAGCGAAACAGCRKTGSWGLEERSCGRETPRGEGAFMMADSRAGEFIEGAGGGRNDGESGSASPTRKLLLE
jgi:hypothetical protein